MNLLINNTNMTIIVKVTSANGPINGETVIKEGIITKEKVIWK